MTGLRERLKTAKCPEETLTIRGERYLVIGLLRSRRSELLASATTDKGKVDSRRLEGVLLSNCILDPDTREQVFTEDEWQEWDGIPSVTTAPLMSEIMRLNGLDNDDVGREVKNSEPTDS